MIRDKQQRKAAQEALAALHRLYNSHVHMLIFSQHKPGWDQQQARVLETQALDALFHFTDLVYGKPSDNQSSLLCDECHMARCSFPHLENEQGIPLFLCSACAQQYQQQQAAAQAEPYDPESPVAVTALPQEVTP